MIRSTRIERVEVLHGRTVRLTLTDGRTRLVDLTPLLEGDVFKVIRADDSRFREVQVDPEFGTLVWPNGADICPDVLVHDRRPA